MQNFGLYHPVEYRTLVIGTAPAGSKQIRQPRVGIRTSWAALSPFLPTRSKIRVTYIGALSFLGGLSESAVLVLLTLTADGLIRDAENVQVLGLSMSQRAATLAALLMVALRVATIMAAATISARFSADVTGRTQRKVMALYLKGAYMVRACRPPGDLSTVIVNHGQATGDLATSFTAVAASLCALFAFGITSLFVNPIATIGISVIGLGVLALMRPLRARSRIASKELAEATRTLGQEVSEVELLHREIELFQVADRAMTRVSVQVDLVTGALRRVKILASATPQLFQAAVLAAAVVSLLLVVDSIGGADLASLGAVVLLLIRSMSAAQQYVTANQRVIDQTSYAESVDNLITTLTQSPTQFGDSAPSSIMPIDLKHLSFNYLESSNALTNVNMRLSKGEIVGIVGPSGAGKSTLVEILLRLREPTSGAIRGGNTRWNQISPSDFARRVAFVPQQAILIAGTVAENIDLFRGLSEDRIYQAIREADLELEVMALSDGIHTRLGPDDRALSGGQRQRLTIARALAGDPELLILDEPTSALDAVSEAAIRRTLDTFATERLVIIVAHRFSTLRSCSRIIALQDGRVEVDATTKSLDSQISSEQW